MGSSLRFFGLVENTAKLGKTIGANERTKGWMLRAGLRLPLLTSSRFIHGHTRTEVKNLDEANSPMAMKRGPRGSSGPRLLLAAAGRGAEAEGREACEGGRGDGAQHGRVGGLRGALFTEGATAFLSSGLAEADPSSLPASDLSPSAACRPSEGLP